MGGEWRQTTLGDVLSFSNGQSSPERTNQGAYPVFGSNGLIGYSDQTNAGADTIVVGRVGSYCGSLQFSKDPCWVTDNAIRARASADNISRFLFYLLEQCNLHQWRGGSGQPLLNQRTLNSISTAVPAPDEQRTIADILGTLDDKIELNRQMNQTLEAMARATFKAWFVDFEPVKAKASGANSFRGMPQPIFDQLPDRFTDSEVGPVPEGWEVVPLDEIADFLNGVALQKYPASPSEDSLPVIKIAELRNGVSAKTGRASREVPSKYIVNDGDFLFSWSGSLLAKFWTEGEGALNQHLFKVTSESYPMWFVSQWVQHHLEVFQAIAASKATTMGHIQRRHLKEALTVCAPRHLLDDMNTVMSPLTEKMVAAEIESRTLSAIRDALLPKLISGELRVPVAEEGPDGG